MNMTANAGIPASGLIQPVERCPATLKDNAELRRRYHDDLNLIMATDEGFICALAIMCTVSGNGLNDISPKYSRGTFKRSIAWIRRTQRSFPEYGAEYEKAIAYIRREWLRREVTTA